MCIFVASSRNGGEHLSAKLDGQYKRLRRIVGYAWRTKRSGIMREMPLSMRVPTSPFTNDVCLNRRLSSI